MNWTWAYCSALSLALVIICQGKYCSWNLRTLKLGPAQVYYRPFVNGDKCQRYLRPKTVNSVFTFSQEPIHSLNPGLMLSLFQKPALRSAPIHNAHSHTKHNLVIRLNWLVHVCADPSGAGHAFPATSRRVEHAMQFTFFRAIHESPERGTNDRSNKGVFTSAVSFMHSAPRDKGSSRTMMLFIYNQWKNAPFQEHEKGKYVSLLNASESQEQGMKKANMFPSSKRNKVRNKAWKRQICFLAPSVTKSGTRHEKGKYVAKGSLRKTYSAPC